MNVRIAPVMILAAVVLTSVPDAAHAQPPLQRDTWLLSGALGLALDADANGSLTVHGAAAFPFTSELAVEGELGHVFDISPGNVGVDVSLTTVHGSVLYFHQHAVRPHAVSGGRPWARQICRGRGGGAGIQHDGTGVQPRSGGHVSAE